MDKDTLDYNLIDFHLPEDIKCQVFLESKVIREKIDAKKEDIITIFPLIYEGKVEEYFVEHYKHQSGTKCKNNARIISISDL